MYDTKAVITGLGIHSPIGNDLDTFWNACCAGKSGIRRITCFDPSALASQIAGEAEDPHLPDMTRKDLARRDRYVLLGLAAADKAWAQAGLTIGEETAERCGVCIGSGIGGLTTMDQNIVSFAKHGPRRVSPFAVPKSLTNMAAGEAAIRFGLRGPNKAIVTACASGTQAIGEAYNLIRLGYCDVVLAGGAESCIMPFGMAAFAAMRALSCRNDEPERASRPFDADRDGFVMGEGAGILVLESESHARKRGAEILGTVVGFGESCDAHHITAPQPDGSGAARAMNASLEDAGLAPEAIDYFNAHGTSTKYNEIAEALALKLVFGAHSPPVSSTKSMIGHLLGAAGAVEAVVCMMSIMKGVIHPSINFETPDPECPVNLVADGAREAEVRYAMSNSMGFGGHNASIIFTRYNGAL